MNDYGTHSYEVLFDLIDEDTGEILTRNKRGTITTEFEVTPTLFHIWLDCFYRGLRQGNNLALQITTKRISFPVQLNCF